MTENDLLVIRELRSDLNKCVNEMVSLRTCFSTWQKTRCEDNQVRLKAVEEKFSRLEIEQTKIIAKSAGAVAVVVLVVNIASIVVAIMAFNLGPGS